jgi:transposase-like protein
MSAPRCDECKRELTDGESAWVTDWTVIHTDTGRARRESRYLCDDCEATR